jgi:hypothetical protein
MRTPQTVTPVKFEWWVAGVLTNAVGVTLASPCGRFGVRRMDNLATVVQAGTPVPNVSTGIYQLPAGIQDPALGLVYEAIFCVVATEGATPVYRRKILRSATGSANATSSADMVEILKSALKENPGAMLTVTVDGQTTTWSRQQAISELQFWERRAAREQGRRPIVAQIGMQF